MSSPQSQLGKRPALCLTSRHGVKRRRTWADKIVERQSANGTEEDTHRVSQRQKQIDLGKDTLAYDCFVNNISREDRKPQHPMTPLATQKCSRRSFVGQIKRWRKMLFDFKSDLDSVNALKSGDVKTERNCGAKEGSSVGACLGVLEHGLLDGSKVPGVDSAVGKLTGTCTESASPLNASTHASTDSGTPLCADDLSDYEEDDGVVLDDMGNLVSIEPGRDISLASRSLDARKFECEIEPVEASMQEPAEKNIFDSF